MYRSVCFSKAHKIGHCWTLSDWTKIYDSSRFRQKKRTTTATKLLLNKPNGKETTPKKATTRNERKKILRLENIVEIVVSELYEMDFYVSLTLCFISHSCEFVSGRAHVRVSQHFLFCRFVLLFFLSFHFGFRFVNVLVCFVFSSVLWIFAPSIARMAIVFFPALFDSNLAAYLTFNCYFTGWIWSETAEIESISSEHALIMGISADDEFQLKMQKAPTQIDFYSNISQ